MTKDEIESEIVALRGAALPQPTGGSNTSVRNGERLVTLRPASPA